MDLLLLTILELLQIAGALAIGFYCGHKWEESKFLKAMATVKAERQAKKDLDNIFQDGPTNGQFETT